MRYQSLTIDVSEWGNAQTSKSIWRLILSHLSKCLSERGFLSFEAEARRAMEQFLGFGADQFSLQEAPRAGGVKDDPMAFTTCFRLEQYLIFADVEMAPYLARRSEQAKPQQHIEIDLFCPDMDSVDSVREQIIEAIMKGFGLTGARSDIVGPKVVSPSRITIDLKGRLTFKEAVSPALYDKVRAKTDRSILLELKKRGSLLESDLKDFASEQVAVDKVRNTLDFFSGQDVQLVERLYAVVCKKTKEIMFLLPKKEEIAKAPGLLCANCGNSIGSETLMAYYKATPALQDLLDGSRWMPLLVKTAFERAGVPADDILTEAKHFEDEIDVLVAYGDRILVCELKDRPVSLNDAYKLSAKTSRLEAVVGRRSQRSATETRSSAARIGDYGLAGDWWSNALGSDQSPLKMVPILMSTQDIAPDAQSLMKDTRPDAKSLANCEEGLEGFCDQIINQINIARMTARFNVIISRSIGDSVTNLVARTVEEGFNLWLKANAAR